MSQYNATAYDVERPTGRCAFTDRELTPGEPYYATLVELTDEELQRINAEAEQGGKKKNTLGLKRLDVSEQAWSGGGRPERMFSYWRSTVPEPNAKPKLFVDDATLMSLLKRMEDETDADKLAFRHVLALVLMRKKLLRYDAVESQDDGQWWVLTPKKDVTKGHFGKWDDTTIRVLDPQLDEAGVLAVTEQLGEILEGDL